MQAGIFNYKLLVNMGEPCIGLCLGPIYIYIYSYGKERYPVKQALSECKRAGSPGLYMKQPILFLLFLDNQYICLQCWALFNTLLHTYSVHVTDYLPWEYPFNVTPGCSMSPQGVQCHPKNGKHGGQVGKMKFLSNIEEPAYSHSVMFKRMFIERQECICLVMSIYYPHLLTWNRNA